MNGKIGFIGQGFVGKAYADNFEARGYAVVRYALEEPYRKNEKEIASCAIVFIAVPTPTTEQGFDDRALVAVMPLVGAGSIVVIKSTVLPETTEKLQALRPDVAVMHCPEFLRAAHAAAEVANPARHIIGVTDQSKNRAEEILAVLPPAPYTAIMDARAAALVKYGGNVFRFLKVLYANTLYELCQRFDVNYETVRQALVADPYIEPSFTDVIHDGGRGVGGPCLVKDFAAYRQLIRETADNPLISEWLAAAEAYNRQLLAGSGKQVAGDAATLVSLQKSSE